MPRRSTWLFPLLLATLAVRLPAEEPVAAFLEELRQRQYYDTAIEYLDRLEQRSDLPDDVKSVLPYEKAVTLQEFARTSRDPDERTRLLDQAEDLLETFTASNPGDERLADANSRRAKILLDKAETDVYRADSPLGADNAAELRQRARKYVTEAREVFEKALEQHRAAYEAFPRFIADDEVRAEWEQAEYEYIQSQFDLAMCTYIEAKTYPEEDAQRATLFGEAAEAFEEIQAKYRTQVIGLHARLWQGKSYEAQGGAQGRNRAIALYKELLEHGAANERNTPENLIALKDQALHFLLNAWNAQEEYRLVRNRANEWLETAGGRVALAAGLGIRWQLARAQEQLAEELLADAAEAERQALDAERKSKDREVPAVQRTQYTKAASDARQLAKDTREEREQMLEDALGHAREISQYGTQYQDVAVMLANRVQVALDGRVEEPENFKEGFVQLQNRAGEIRDAAKAVDEAQNETERTSRQADLDELLRSTERLARITLELARSERVTDPEAVETPDVNRTKYVLAYVYWQMGRNFEAAVVGDYVARKHAADDSPTPREAAFLALAAMQKEYARATENARDDDNAGEAELRLMVDVARFLVETWPRDNLANSARMLVGDVYASRSEPVAAAEWFTGVSESAESYLEAQLKAGQGFWGAYVRAANLPENEQPSAEVLDQWRTQAVEHLRQGVEKKQEQTPPDTPPDEKFELIRGKITLAEILIADGQDQAAVDFLTGDPHAPLAAIQVSDDAERPPKGVRSRTFARAVYELLLRGYIGTQKTDEALQAMARLEEVTGGANLQLYEDLGRNLQQEIERLKDLGQTERLAEVRASFDAFLEKLNENKAGQSYNSLLWIAETYYGLGAGVGEAGGSAEYFDKAAEAYELILQRARSEPGFAPDANLSGIRLRLARCRRAQENFEQAYAIVLDLLAELPKAMDAQFEAARVLQEWGEAGVAESPEKFEQAMKGIEEVNDGKPVEVYGWRKIADVYTAALSAGTVPADDGNDRLAQAYYNLCESQLGLAKAQSNSQQRREALQKADRLVYGVAFRGGGFDPEQREMFDDLYATVQSELGVTDPKRLKWPKDVEPTAVATTPPPDPNPPSDPTTGGGSEDGTAAEPVDDGGPGVVTVLVALLLCAGAGAGVYFTMGQPRRRPRPVYAGAAAAPGAASPARRPAKKSSRGGSEAAPAGKKPAGGKSRPAGPASPQGKPAGKTATSGKTTPQGQRPAKKRKRPPQT